MIIEALLELRPNAEFTLNGESYDGLVWLDKNQTKPTEEEVNKWVSVNTHVVNAKRELTILDITLPRLIEDLYMAIGKTPYGDAGDVMARKAELRKILSE